ncbi:hypothetical protein EDB83DRAFT_2385082 [Lactarius deliciosus]|nr:hypothetical protein EDB83DRAFT_2385082 [Lactarius deliciosus]
MRQVLLSSSRSLTLSASGCTCESYNTVHLDAGHSTMTTAVTLMVGNGDVQKDARATRSTDRFPVLVTTSLTDSGRQGANSAVRFTTYTTIKQFAVLSQTRTGHTLPSNVTFGVGAIAGLVYTTMPLECVGPPFVLTLTVCVLCQRDKDAHTVARGASTIP